MMLRQNVKRKSVIATAKIVLYESVPYGVSPWLTCTIYAVMVETGFSGLIVRLGSCPAAIATIIVSPIAREKARMIEAIIPENADGKTTESDTCSFDAPSA